LQSLLPEHKVSQTLFASHIGPLLVTHCAPGPSLVHWLCAAHVCVHTPQMQLEVPHSLLAMHLRRKWVSLSGPKSWCSRAHALARIHEASAIPSG
jgi:hypothetical protein